MKACFCSDGGAGGIIWIYSVGAVRPRRSKFMTVPASSRLKQWQSLKWQTACHRNAATTGRGFPTNRRLRARLARL